MVSHSLVDAGEFSVVVGEGALSALGPAYGVMCASTQSLQALRVLFFKDRSLFQECGKVLIPVSKVHRRDGVKRILLLS